MSVAPALAIDAAGDAAGNPDTNLETDNLHLSTLKTDDTKDSPKAHLGVFGGIEVTPYHSEQKPVAKTFFGQNRIPDISELGLSLDNADTLPKQTNPANVPADLATASLEGATGIDGPQLINQSEVNSAGKAESEVEVDVLDENAAHGIHCACYSYHELSARLEPRNAWENCNAGDRDRDGDHDGDRERAEKYSSRHCGASIRSANSSDEAAFSDYGTREEPLVTTYSDELDSPKLTAGRSGYNCVAFEAEEIYDPYVAGSQYIQQDVDNQATKHQYQKSQGTYVANAAEDLSPEQFRRQLDNYMEAETTDHIRYSPTSSSNESNICSSASSAANLYDGFVPVNKHKINDQESDNDDVDDEVDDDDEAVDVEDVHQHERGPKFVCLPRSRKGPKRKSYRYWSNTGVMVRNPRGPLCLYDEPSSPPSEETPIRNDSPRPPKDSIHPLLRSYNDLRGGAPTSTSTSVGAARGGDRGDRGDRGDIYQKLYQKSLNDSSKKKPERTRPSFYNRVQKFFKTFLRKKSSESTQTEPGPLPIT